MINRCLICCPPGFNYAANKIGPVDYDSTSLGISPLMGNNSDTAELKLDKKNQIEINGTVQEEMDPRPECIWRVGGNWPQDSLPIK